MSTQHSVQKRLLLILSLFSIGLVALLGRLFYIQIWARHDMQGHDLVATSVEQRKETWVIDSGRGDILDRNGKSLTGSRIRGVLVMPLWTGDPDRQKLKQLADILQTDLQTLQQNLAMIDRPALLRLPDKKGSRKPVELTDSQAASIEKLHLPGIYPKEVKIRYDENSLARHLIGFVGLDPQLAESAFGGKYPSNEQIGKMGLEYLFQNELRGLGKRKEISYFIGADKQPINGLGIQMKEEENHALSVKTTLDYNVQKTAEAAMDQYGLTNGSVVVMDAASEEILAMASRPQFDQDAPLKQNEYPVNKALEADFPGSVFKTVIAAAALEKGIVHADDVFNCPGYIEIGDGRLNCWTTHGKITAEQGFAESCNVVFSTLAMKLGRQTIEEYADKFGLGKPPLQKIDGKPQVDREDAGQIFAKPETSDRLLANTGIGQEDVRLSPLQVAHMMAVVSQGGLSREPRLLKEWRTSPDNELYKTLPAPAKPTQVIKPETARELQRWMREVVSEPKGTAHLLNSAKMPVAGKTGTAQTGKENAYHYWFSGYAPADHPKYVIVVMAKDVETENGSQMVQNVTRQIVDSLP
ncbi:peptidoglycan D,D-transpeptidase FtsI family protein [Effusibacillus dendaii]|uniref:Penicillin-binding protein 4B n=1 Tax=Effusibacillus dendaii TaxID=2743772 RepID=A0A7I8DCP3_9BACL|nr:penicillin-binding protein 2 [Effusibacillus dendaii]BCJ86290.1 penicillin-binding protein 4B [Effusibacillus dendaii]